MRFLATAGRIGSKVVRKLLERGHEVTVPLTIFGDGEKTRDFMDGADVAAENSSERGTFGIEVVYDPPRRSDGVWHRTENPKRYYARRASVPISVDEISSPKMVQGKL